MRKSLIKLKTRPSAPRRGTVGKTYEMGEGTTLLELVRWIETLGIYNEDSLSTTRFYYDGGYDGCYGHRFVTEIPEPIEEYKKRIDVYEKELAKYEEWYDANKELIEQEKSLRKKDLEEKAKKAKIEEKNRLSKQLLRIQKDIKRLDETGR